MIQPNPTSASQFQRGLVTARAACGVLWCLIPLNLCLQRVLIHCVKCQIAKPNRTHATSRSNYKRRRRKRSCLSQWLRCKDSHKNSLEMSWSVLLPARLWPDSCKAVDSPTCPRLFLLLAAPCCTLLHLAPSFSFSYTPSFRVTGHAVLLWAQSYTNEDDISWRKFTFIYMPQARRTNFQGATNSVLDVFHLPAIHIPFGRHGVWNVLLVLHGPFYKFQ